MPDYSLGKIYTIRNYNDHSLIYIGSTCGALSQRLYHHKNDCKNKEKYPNNKLYSIVESWDDWYIELYELCPCKSKEELLKREGEVIREIGTLNRSVAGRTNNEWKKENPEKMKPIRERERLKEIEKGRNIKTICGCGGSYSAKSIREHERCKKHLNYLKQQEATGY